MISYCNFEIIASPILDVDASFIPSDKISFVLKPSFSTSWTAFSRASASLGAKNKDGEMRAMYEPIHGSAPDIAGKGIANPIASILSFAMALRYSLDLDNEADVLEKAVQEVLNDGLRTKDILSDGKKEVSTSAMGDAIISKLQ